MDYWRQSVLFMNFIACCILGYAFPLSKGFDELSMETAYYPSYAAALISVGALLFLAYFVFGCVCCPNKNIKALSYQNGFPISHLNENAFDNPAEITIFPPQSVIDLQPVNPVFPPFNDKVTFEPLPDILPKNLTSGPSAASSSRPAHFSALLKTKVSLHDWFDDPTSNFPREQLQYLQEIGCGWFGRVVEGEASKICDNEEKKAVIVKILREEASPSEHLHFLHEVRPYRDLKHPNVIQLLGRCLESDPFLLIMEYTICDLKSFLLKQDSCEIIMKDEQLLQIISNISSGLNYMHEKGYFHTDLAAHNCFVTDNQVVKIGDYGISFDRWKGDYYCLGDVALPIRWYSPEILLCSETTIEPKDITKEANVWAFGVVLWEIVNFGRLPYENLSDEEVLQMVLIEKSVQLPLPTHEFNYKNEISLVMRECWKSKKYRPTMDKIESFIFQFCTDKLSMKNKELTFEERWNSIHPKITEISSYTGTDSSSLKFENDFSTRSDLQNYSSDNEILSSFDVSFDMLPKNELKSKLSPSLNVLNGSIDELTDNDAYLNSASLSYGKYDADTLSNISDKDNFHMEEDKDQFQSNNTFPRQKSSAVRNLDLVVANQPDLSQKLTVKCASVESGVLDNEKEMFLNGVSDVSDVSESFYSKSSNLSEYLDPVVSERYNGMSSTSDLNGNCNFCSNSVSNDELFCLNGTSSKSEKNQKSNDTSLEDNIDNCNNNVKDDILCDNNRFTNKTDSCAVSAVPDIIIHETATNNLAENDEETQSISYQGKPYHQSSAKVYRFVLKEDSNKSVVQLNHQEFSKGLNEEVRGSVQNRKINQPVTSTPVRNSSYSFSPPECSENRDIAKSNITFENKPSWDSSNYGLNEVTLQADGTGSDQKFFSCQNGSSASSSALDHFVTAQSTLGYSQSFESENNSTFHDVNGFTIHHSSDLDVFDAARGNSNISNTLYVTVEEEADTKDNQSYSDVISPPKDYISSKNAEIVTDCDKKESEGFTCSRTSDTVSPPQGFQDFGLTAHNDSFSESKTSFGLDFSTSADCGSSENLEQFLEDDEDMHLQFAGARLLENSFPEVASKSFTYENCAEVAGNLRPVKNGSSSSSLKNNSGYDLEFDHPDYKKYNSHDSLNSFRSCDQMIVEDLDTGEQTVINEAYSLCDDYDNSAESDEILKINIETDEAIIVDSSETLIGFVPSRSIELLQEFEIIPPLTPPCEVDEERESPESVNVDACSSASPSPAAIKHFSSPIESSELNYHPQPYRDFSLQNQVIEEEITEEIASPSSFHSSSSYCSNEIFLDDEKMSQSSESVHQGEMYETSVMPSVDHVYVNDDVSKSDVSSYECSPVKHHRTRNSKYCPTDRENNEIFEDEEDVMHSFQPTQSVRWLSDETLDVDGDGQNPVILEGQEILAGDIMQKSELTAEDIACALSQLESKDHLHGLPTQFLNVSQSPSPYSSVESSPCREAVYTPDFESDSEETGSGASCSSTSGSFECIHNRFKHAADISKLPDESDKSVSSREQSPMKVFSKSWNCHATPTKGVLVTPEKKLNSMRKSVSFHDADPQVVFEYPPASDSSEEEYLSDDNQEYRRNIDLSNYADWDLQICDAEDAEVNDTFEIEELESEPYVRRPSYSSSSVGPLNRPMLYTFTSGFSDEEGDIPDAVPSSLCQAPSNSPDEKEASPLSNSHLSDLLNSHLNSLMKDNQDTFVQRAGNSNGSASNSSSEPKVSVQEAAGNSVEVEDIVIEKLVPEEQAQTENATVQNDFAKTDFDWEEIIVEELEDDPEAASPMKAVPESILNSSSEAAVGAMSHEANGLPVRSTNVRSEMISSDLSVLMNEASPDLLGSTAIDPVISYVDEQHGDEVQAEPESVLTPDCSENDTNVGFDRPCLPGERKIELSNLDYAVETNNKNIPLEQSNSVSYACPDLLLDSNLKSVSCPVQEVILESAESAIQEKERVADLGLSFEDKSCYSSDGKLFNVCSRNSGSQSDISSTVNKVSEESNLIQSIGSNCMEENNVQSDNVCENVFYENTELPKACINQGNSEAEGINQATKVGVLIFNDDAKEIGNDKHEVTPSNNTIQKEVICKISPIVDLINKEGETSDGKNCDIDMLLSVPKIVVTPASGSESEDDLIECLKEQPVNFMSDSPSLRNFSVTSGFSNQPFDDSFGTYGAEESADYAEAFNFEFESGNFYEDLVNDYPMELQASGMLCPDDGMGKRSSSLPVMTENISDDESLTMKSDSSLVYDMSKGITRL